MGDSSNDGNSPQKAKTFPAGEVLPGDPDPWPYPTVEQARALAGLLPDFERSGARFGALDRPRRVSPDGPFMMPVTKHSDLAERFVQAAYDNGFVVPFDWNWPDVELYRERDAPALATADLMTIQRLITGHVRSDRFVEGHLIGEFERGMLTVILQRLAQLVNKVPQNS